MAQERFFGKLVRVVYLLSLYKDPTCMYGSSETPVNSFIASHNELILKKVSAYFTTFFNNFASRIAYLVVIVKLALLAQSQNLGWLLTSMNFIRVVSVKSCIAQFLIYEVFEFWRWQNYQNINDIYFCFYNFRMLIQMLRLDHTPMIFLFFLASFK